jgi:UPF0148 protein
MAASTGKGMAKAVELLRKGATLLKEPCPKCSGLQVKYKGRTLCVSCANFNEVFKVETVPAETVLVNLKEMIVQKINQTSSLLKEESSLEKQSELASLIIKYLELLERLKKIS